MAQNKHKTKRRIICILCASIIALYAFAIPIGAVVNSSQGGFLDFNLTANSTFPLTVGFSYVTRDTSTGAGNTYVYATEIGGFGEEWNTTLYGADTYTQNYTPIEGVEYQLEGSLEYNFLEREFPEVDNIYFTDGSAESIIKRGYQTISFQNKAPSGSNILGQQQGVVLRARDVVYNPAWLMATEDNLSQTNESMLPMFLTPTVENPSSEAVVLTYSWSCTIIDQEGVEHNLSNFELFDTRVDNSSRYVPIIPIDVLEEYKTQPTIVIAEYRGFLDVDYYEYVEPEVVDELAGTWVFNPTLNLAHTFSGGEKLFYLNGSFSNKYNSSMTPEEVSLKMIGVYGSSTVNTNRVTLYSVNDKTEQPRFVTYLYSSSTSKPLCFYKTSTGSESSYEVPITNEYIDEIRTITINSSLSEVIDGNDLLAYLQSNAIKQDSTATVVEEGTWEQVEKGGDGYLLKLRYPLYDTSGVTITNTQAYSDFMAYYGFPTLDKYIDTDGTIIKPSPPYKVDFTGWLGTAVGGFLDFELFEGFSLGGLLSVLIGFSFIMLFLKFFAGG